MNREYIIIIICILFVGFFYMQSGTTTTEQPVDQVQQPDPIQSDINDTTNTTAPDSLRQQLFIMDGTKRYWLEKLFYAGWTYIGLMLLFAGGLSKFGHLIVLAFCLCMLQNYLAENN